MKKIIFIVLFLIALAFAETCETAVRQEQVDSMQLLYDRGTLARNFAEKDYSPCRDSQSQAKGYEIPKILYSLNPDEIPIFIVGFRYHLEDYSGNSFPVNPYS